jgi:hypothetical protein|tara:strand:+ start:133 stop:1014 length:882 start_codon:yes stop_codon:yes gene_type:complete
MIKYIAVAMTVLFTTAVSAAEVIPYGTFNYKWSHDENASGVAYDKLEDNGSLIGVEIIDLGVEGDTILGFAKLEVGVDTDDSGSDTFDSRLAYVGLDTEMGDLSVGRQSHPYTDNVATRASIFNVYGGNSSFSYGTRSSNSLAYSNKIGPVSIDALTVVDGSSGEDNGMDSYEWSASADILGSNVSAGYADDIVNDISYYGVSAETSLEKLTVSSSYTIKDAATDLAAWEVGANYSILSVGYGDKENTGTYTTVGLAKDLNDSLTVYAEAEMADNDGSAVDTQKWSIGTKFTF